MTPERLQAEAERKRLEERHRHIATGSQSRMSNPLSGTEITSQTLQNYAEKHPLRVVKYLDSKLEEAVTGNLLPEINNWKAFGAADQMIRRNLGLDKPAAAVQVNLWGSGTSAQMVEADPFEE